MLKGISPIISPQLLEIMARMGHGDEILLADAHYPCETFNSRVVRADGLRVPELLEAMLELLVLDEYVEHPLIMMAAVNNDVLDPEVEASFLKAIRKSHPEVKGVLHIDKPAFYERSKSAFAIVATGETCKYGNIILKKGVTPLPEKK
ncbi:MAG: L-fucose mutarotase [Mangrovibacterium sp.]